MPAAVAIAALRASSAGYADYDDIDMIVCFHGRLRLRHFRRHTHTRCCRLSFHAYAIDALIAAPLFDDAVLPLCWLLMHYARHVAPQTPEMRYATIHTIRCHAPIYTCARRCCVMLLCHAMLIPRQLFDAATLPPAPFI